MKIVVAGTSIEKSLYLKMKMVEMWNRNEGDDDNVFISLEDPPKLIEGGFFEDIIPNIKVSSHFDDNCNDDLTQREKELESLENLRKSKRKWKK